MNINLKEFWQVEFDEHEITMKKTFDLLRAEFIELVETATKTIENGGKIMFFGNGGSASDAQHLATELAVRYKTDRKPIASIALTTDTSSLTAIGNDYGFDYLFSRQIEALGNAGDMVIGISTSGTSPNVIRALKQARGQNITVVGFSGETGGDMVDLCDIIFRVPSKTTARIQEMHITIGQMLCGALEQNLGLVVEDNTMKKVG